MLSKLLRYFSRTSTVALVAMVLANLSPNLNVRFSETFESKLKKSGTMFHNYEGFFSFQLVAVCNSKYNSIFANNDCLLLSNSTIGYAIEQNTLNIPESNVIECIEDETSYFQLRNEIFLLNTWLMRPYPGLLPEHHLLIENAFGIFTMRRWIFQRAIS